MSKFERARLLIGQRRFSQAEDLLKQVLSEDPEDAIAHSTLSLCQRETNQMSDALISAQKGVALEPESAYTHYQLAWTYHALKQFRPMIKTVHTLMAIAPYSADAHCLEAVYWANRERAEKMLRSAEKGLQCDPSHLPCQLIRVRGLIDLWRWDEAMEEVHRLFQRDPNNTQIFAARGWIHYLKGRQESALRDFKESLRLDPDNDWAKQGLIRVLKDRNPLNFMHYINPYGKALFAPRQVRANYWITAAPFVLIAGAGIALLTSRWIFLSGAIALFFTSYLATSAISAETAQERRQLWAAVGCSAVAAIAFMMASNISAPNVSTSSSAIRTVLLCLSATTSILAWLCAKSWRELNEAFRMLFVLAGGLAAIGAVALLLSLLPTALTNPLATAGIFVAKLAITLFLTLELGRFQFR